MLWLDTVDRALPRVWALSRQCRARVGGPATGLPRGSPTRPTRIEAFFTPPLTCPVVFCFQTGRSASLASECEPSPQGECVCTFAPGPSTTAHVVAHPWPLRPIPGGQDQPSFTTLRPAQPHLALCPASLSSIPQFPSGHSSEPPLQKATWASSGCTTWSWGPGGLGCRSDAPTLPRSTLLLLPTVLLGCVCLL